MYGQETGEKGCCGRQHQLFNHLLARRHQRNGCESLFCFAYLRPCRTDGAVLTC
jgi:hypothetical protein